MISRIFIQGCAEYNVYYLKLLDPSRAETGIKFNRVKANFFSSVNSCGTLLGY